MSNAYQTYIAALKRYPRLTPQEVDALVQEYRAPIGPDTDYTRAREALSIEASIVGLRAAKAAHARYMRHEGTEPSMDLVQEATMAALAAIDTFRPDGGASFRGWLMRRAYGAALDWLKLEQAHGMGSKDHVADVSDVDNLLDPDDGDDSPLAYDPIAEIDSEDAAAFLEHKIMLMAPYLRNILVSYYGYRAKRMTLAEIAAREGVSLSTIRNHLQQAIEMLRGTI